MSKSKGEELLEWLDEKVDNYDDQAYQQIKKLIQKLEVSEEELAALFYRFIEIGRENDKVSDDYAVTKAREFVHSLFEER